MDIKDLGYVDFLPTWEAMKAFTAQRADAAPESQKTSQTGRKPGFGGRDVLWICEHAPVFTQGLAGKAEHVLNAGNIPVVQTDRGGQVTYHGPGQLVAYPLIDLRRAGYFVKEYVFRLEEAVIRTLAHFGVTGHRVRGAPGIYVRLDDPFGHAALPVPAEPPIGLPPRRGHARAEPHFVQAEPHPVPAEPPPVRAEPVEAPASPFDGLKANGVEVAKIAALGIKVSRHCTYHGVALNVAMDLQPFSQIEPCGYAGLRTVDLSTIGVSASRDDVAAVLAGKLVQHLGR